MEASYALRQSTRKYMCLKSFAILFSETLAAARHRTLYPAQQRWKNIAQPQLSIV